MNPQTKQKRIVCEYPIAELSEATGVDVRDAEGNLYFAGRKTFPKDDQTPETLPSIDDKVSIPFMIKFNPEKELE